MSDIGSNSPHLRSACDAAKWKAVDTTRISTALNVWKWSSLLTTAWTQHGSPRRHRKWRYSISRLIHAARILCGSGSMQRLGVRPSISPSVCPIDRQQQQRSVSLLLSALWAGNVDRYLRACCGRRAAGADAQQQTHRLESRQIQAQYRLVSFLVMSWS